MALANTFRRIVADPVAYAESLMYSSRDPYQYIPLSTSGDTRIFELHFDHPYKGISISLMHVNLQESHASSYPKYIAVSYAWEGQSPSEHILCNGKSMLITPTLASYLHREKDRLKAECRSSQCYWADAISINQAQDGQTLVERGLQVSMMHEIFSKATKVEVWLGATRKEDHEVLMYLRRYCSFTERGWEQLEPDLANEEKLRILGLPGFSSAFWSRCWRFMDRSYFSRLWIIQEFALAREVEFVIGTSSVSLTDFINFADRIQVHVRVLHTEAMKPPESDLETLEPTHISRPFYKVHHHRRFTTYSWSGSRTAWLTSLDIIMRKRQHYHAASDRFTGDPERQVCQHLVDTRFFRSSDSRDRVYALLGISDDRESTALAVDYKETPKQLAERVTHYMIEQGYTIQCLFMLSEANAKGECGWRLRLQQGADDAYLNYQLAKLTIDKNGGCHLFRACGNTVIHAVCSTRSDLRRRITLRGQIIGSVVVKHDDIFTIFDPQDARKMFKDPFVDLNSFAGFLENGTPTVRLLWYTGGMQMRFARVFRAVGHFIRSHASGSAADIATFEEACWRTMFCDLSLAIVPKQRLPAVLNSATESDVESEDATSLTRIIECSRLVSASNNVPCEGILDEFKNFSEHNAEAFRLSSGAQSRFHGKRLALLTDGRPCLLQPNAQEGDIACILYGCPLPVLLRPLPSGEYLYAGPCYVHGMMDGQALGPDGKDLHPQDFVLLPGGPEDEDEP